MNLAGNEVIGSVSKWTAALKVLGILAFAAIGITASGLDFKAASAGWTADTSAGGFVAGVALAILAFKGFTTITNSGVEVVEPEKNIARAIAGSLVICVVVYLLVALAVGTSLELDAIIEARDMTVHRGVFRNLHEDVGANRAFVASAFVLDGVALVALAAMKADSDPAILAISAGVMVVVLAFERLYLGPRRDG